MTREEKIRIGLICPYCDEKPERIDSDAIYSKSYGDILICKPCRAWVGIHRSGENKGKPLGRLADAKLREAKKEAHRYFDQLWRRKMRCQGISKMKARNAAYDWLAGEMEMSREICHIGMMNERQCELVIFICKPFFREEDDF